MQAERISLSPTEQVRFLELLENPAPINPKLSRAIERYTTLARIYPSTPSSFVIPERQSSVPMK